MCKGYRNLAAAAVLAAAGHLHAQEWAGWRPPTPGEQAQQVTASTPEPSPVFDSAEHRAYAGDGTASIKGQAFLRQNGGGVVTCAGAEVFAFPATDYFQPIRYPLRALIEGGTDSIDNAAKRLVRRTMCDAQGNFEIANLPAGEWIVITSVEWSVGYRSQGGYLKKLATAATAAAPAIYLTEPDRVD